MRQWKSLLVGAGLLGLVACGESTSTTEDTAPEAIAENAPVETPAPAPERGLITESFSPKQYDRYRPELVAELKLLDSLYKQAPFYVEIGNRRLYYVNIGVQDYDAPLKFHAFRGKYGIVDTEGRELLPPEYSKLYQPDRTTPGYIEVEKDDKRGLWNYSNGNLIPCTYDAIYPFVEGESIAIGQRGEDFYYLSWAGSTKVTDPADLPTYVNVFSGRRRAFFPATQPHPIYFSYEELTPDEPNDVRKGMELLPSWKAQLDFWPAYTYIGPPEDWEVEEEYVALHYIDTVEQIDEYASVLTAFYQAGIGTRDDYYEDTSYELVLVGKDNQVIDRIKIDHIRYLNANWACKAGRPMYSFITPRLLEIQNTTHQAYHEAFRSYTYYQIEASGHSSPLKSNRAYPSTQFVKMDSSYFYTCWEDHLSGDDWKQNETNFEIGSHFTLEDLDIMRNEIFASYGYRFKGEKWQDYFGKKKWYRPRFDNVDDQLTEIDRHNIDLLLQVKADMQAHPERYPSPQLTWVSEAG